MVSIDSGSVLLLNDEERLQAFAAMLTGFWLTDLANASAFFYQQLPPINWAGFYLNDGERLRLGPFVGKPACTEIAYSRGVCGAAYRHGKTLVVNDVSEFPGHIACDGDSKSELVVPFYFQGTLVGVCDLDAPVLARFTSKESDFVEAALSVLARKIERNAGFPLA
jgi:L-methionine (R)-S-oxide reductase